jgi:endonuclease/exonuclease/phosphatase family metal-dependent hydrolase
MEIISYNVWDLPLWFVKNRDKRMLEIAKYFVERGTEIICLQESWSMKHRKILSDYLRLHGYADAVAMSGMGRKSGGLLTFSKFPILSINFISFGRRGAAVSEILGNKGALETVIETPKGIIKVINTHLHYQSTKMVNTASIRLRQLRDIFSNIRNEDPVPIILAGDFNEHAMFSNDAFETIFKAEQFSYLESDNRAPTYRQENFFVNNWINRIRESYRYDYIVTKGIEKTGLSVYAYAPLYLHPPLSDHDPVSMVLL